jgi:hypothetical protein
VLRAFAALAARGEARRGAAFGRAEACGFRARAAGALGLAGVVRLAVPRVDAARALVFFDAVFLVAMDHILER